MSRKQLIALLVVLALLVIARLVLHSGRSSTALRPGEAGLGHVLATRPDAADIRWMRVSGPAALDGSAAAAAATPVPLELVKAGDAWTLTSAEGAAGDAAAVDDFISRALALSGEVRGEGEAAWLRFGLTPDLAARVDLGSEPGQPLTTIWLGKEGDAPGAHFVRAEGSAWIRHCRNGLRATLGLWSETAQPAPDLFLQRSILEIDPAQLESVSIERADATFTLTRVTGEGEGAGWTVSSPALPWVIQADSLDGVISRAGRVRIARALPATSAACAGEGGPVRMTFTRRADAGAPAPSGPSVLRLGGRVDGSEEIALRLEGNPTCHALASSNVPTLLPPAGALWSIPLVFFEMASAEPPRRVRYQRGGASVELTRSKEGTWGLSGGGGDSARCGRVASALRELRIDDAAELARVPPEALAVEATLSAEMGGRSIKLEILGPRPGALGDRYARISGGTLMPPGWIAVLSASSVATLLPTMDDLRGSGA